MRLPADCVPSLRLASLLLSSFRNSLGFVPWLWISSLCCW